MLLKTVAISSHSKFIELIRRAHISRNILALFTSLCNLPLVGALALSQPLILTNGQRTLSGLDAGIHLDSPARKKIDLSGVWMYSFDNETWKEVQVPASFDYEGKIFFSRKMTIEENLVHTSAFKFVALGINYECEVYVNDIFIGKHIGGYTSFEFEIPEDAFEIGQENTIKIIVSNVLNARSTLPVRQQIWGWKNYCGILRDVYLLATPRLWIDQLHVHTNIDGQTKETTLSLNGIIMNKRFIGLNRDSLAKQQKQISYLLNAEVYERFSDILVAQGISAPLALELNKDAKVQLTLTVNGSKLWSPENPDLYLLKTSIVSMEGKQKTVIDQYNLNIGFTAIQIDRQAFLINGNKATLNGVVWHEDSPRYGASLSYEQMEKDVVLIKSLGANAIRFVSHPPHPYMLNLCSRYGLIAFEETSVWNIPADMLGDEAFQILAETQVREMVERDNAYPCLVAWGIGDQFDSADKRAVEFVSRMKSVIRSSDDRPVYYGSRMLVSGEDASAADFVGITVPPLELKKFRQQLNEWKKNHRSQPLIILGYGKEVDQYNRTGYSDPMSQEAQARFFLQQYTAIKEINVAGSFISAFADWRGDRPMFSFGFSDYYVYSVGLLNSMREKRLAYDVVRALYNDEHVSAIPAGNYHQHFPVANVLTGLFVIIFIGYMYTNRRFGESLKRSLLRSYNFFVDLRDLHTVSVLHTLVLAVAISITLAGLLSSVLLHYRGDMFADYILTYFLLSDTLKEQVIYATWHPFAGIVAFTGLFFICSCVLALLIKIFAFLVKVHVSWFHVYSVSTWAAAPVVFLTPLVMSLFKIMENSSYILPLIILLVLYLMWILMRVLKGISVIYDFRPAKTYAGGILLCIIVLGGLFLYYDSVHALRPYFKLIVHLAQSLG